MLMLLQENLKAIKLHILISPLTPIGVALFSIFVLPANAQEMLVEGTCASYRYEEPALMQLAGNPCAIGLGFFTQWGERSRVGIEARWSKGVVDYTSKQFGNSTGQNQSISDLRVLGFTNNQLFRNVTPYTGLAMRRLVHDAQGMTTSSGGKGYLRISNYYYLPMGLKVRLDNSYELQLEYAHLIEGRQESLTPAGSVENHQLHGYGYFVSVMLSSGSWSFGPYVQQWRVDASDIVTCFSGVQLCREPANSSFTYGARLSYSF